MKYQKQKGFTLIEVLIVLAIIGLMSSIAVTSTIAVRERARVTKTASEFNILGKAVELFHDQYGYIPCTYSLPVMNSWDDDEEASQFQTTINWPRRNQWGGVYLFSGAPIGGQPYAIMTNNVPVADATAIDAIIDDGNLSTGLVRSVTGGPIVNIVFGLPSGMRYDVSGQCPARLGHVLPA